MDRQGWNRSYHQRQFHEQFIRACARIFYKTEPPGTFQRDHQKLLQLNGWQNLSQEILISTPRRFGKTISVSLFAAAILYSAPRVELSIYSTCKRISQKLLRNVKKFLDLVYIELDVRPYRIVRSNCEELVIQGPESRQDLRVVNSYPSKVNFLLSVRLKSLLKLFRIVTVNVKHLGHPVHGRERSHNPYRRIPRRSVEGLCLLVRALKQGV